MINRLQWGILGTGMIARRFATDLATSRTGRLVAIGSRGQETADRFAADFGGVRAHGSYEALLADPAVQAVYVSPPHPAHLEWIERAAAAGKHILCEKPLTLRRADTQRAIETARARGVFLMEAFMYRCHPQTEKIATLIADGAIGRVRTIRAAFCIAVPFDPAHRLFSRSLGGGGILDLGCYPVSYSRRMAGAANGRTFVEPDQFKALGHRLAQTGVDDHAVAIATFPGEIVAELSCGSTARHDNAVQIHGEAGWIDLRAPYHPGDWPGADVFTLHRAGCEPEAVRTSVAEPLYAVEADTVAAALAAGARESAAMSHADSLGNATVLDDWLAQVGVSYEC
ncbi:MAG TPA: Gfo/Idh/MocA family oxidoreductase [Acidobacteriota bacterium]|nr:Gfo/Idh/MocA family oxidoreductase [Acidobacteriota bacterium]